MVGVENEDWNTVSPPSYYGEMPKQHRDYYNERGNFTVQVEDTLFKISDMTFWTHSDFFNVENGAQPKTNQIWKLDNVGTDDFTRLLWVLYPREHGKCEAKTVEDWEGVLKLADHWKFTDVFNLSVRNLAKLPIEPVRKIEIMHRHHIRKDWAIDALVKLALQPEFPDDQDAEVIGLHMVTRLAKTREKVARLPIWNRSNVSHVQMVVCEVFGLDANLPESGSWAA